ncbi:MAG: methyltransferase [Alloprevotella sp.]|nr:methyltransferase [Alloprevotella sp.]
MSTSELSAHSTNICLRLIIFVVCNKHQSLHMPFQFQQFFIDDTHCAHKVGTDGVLLGAWTDIQGATNVLDIGCGSGLVGLIVAQRSPARVTGVEIDEAAANDATLNAARSPWNERIRIVCADIRTYEPEERFDAILSNPPFFNETLLPPDDGRALARHTALLPFDTLLHKIDRLGTDDCRLSMVLPYHIEPEFTRLAVAHTFFLTRKTLVHTKQGKPCKRVLVSYSREPLACQQDTLTLTDESGARTSAYQQLTSHLYL